MPSQGKSRFNLNGSKVGGGAPNTRLPPGKYRVRVEKQFTKPSEDGSRTKTEYFISEFTVVEVHAGGEAFTDKHGNEFPATKAGDYRSWANDMGYTGSAGTLNEYLCAVYGVDPSDAEAVNEADIDFDKLCEEALDPKNPMRGEEVEVSVSCKTTKKNNHFMNNRFSVAASG